MNRVRRVSVAGAALFAGLVLMNACSKGHDNPKATEGAKAAGTDTPASTEMAGMPGMPGMPDAGDTTSASTVTFTAAQVQHGKVLWEPAVMGTASASAIVPGQLVPNEDRTSRLGAPARGRVIAVRVQPGDRVSRGQLLVTLQSPEAGMAQADAAKAQAEVTSRRAQSRYARSARERADRLLALKAIPRQDYERAIADDEAAHAALTQAEAELRRARSTAEQLGAGAGAGAGASPSGEIALRSPLAGVVLARTAIPGSVIEAGSPLVVVTDPSSLWLQVSAPEKFASLFRQGGRLRLTVPAYAADTFSARIEAVGAGLDPTTRTLTVRGVVPSGGKLKAEMLATVVVEGVAMVPAVILPDDAVQLLDGKAVVFVAKPDGNGGAQLVARPVEVGSRARGRVAVIRGLSAGDVVVTRGAFAIKAQLRKGSMPGMEM
jgi:cobalt-zinc-cadmium efflux system membrane fusion protein